MSESEQIFSDLIRYETRLYNALDERLRARHKLAASQYEVLRLIGRGQARTVGDLAHEVAITVGAASKSVDRLEAAGWVLRSPNPSNRRSSLLHLTDLGAQMLEQVTPTVEQTLHMLIVEPLTDRSLQQFATTLNRLRQAIDEANLGQPARGNDPE